MTNHFLSLILGIAPAAVFAASATALPDAYFNPTNPILTPQEKAAIAITQQWQGANGADVKPVPGPDGAITFTFGASQPSIVCAVLQVCDVSLQPGEQVNSIDLGDAVRWAITPSIAGTGASETQHLIIKPLDVGLETTLVVATDRRMYHLRLRSHRTEYMAAVKFNYPEDARAKWEAIRARATKERKDNTIPSTGEYLGDLSFDYMISGSAPWKPVRVFNNGHKTIIQMPSVMSQTEAPSLLLVRKNGSIFTKEETDNVNYRVQGDRYIVDTVFDKAILVVGVGPNQDRVTIQKGR